MTIGILGAGSIGCYVGGRLLQGGAEVLFVGREALGEELAEHGLHLIGVDGAVVSLPPERIRWTTQATDLSDCEMVLVAVKGLATAEVGEQLARILGPQVAVVSLQNGVSNLPRLREALGDRPVYACNVSFNVLRRGEGRFLHGTSGPLSTSREAPPELVSGLRAGGLAVEQHADMVPVLWGKLLVNLNNALNALAGVPLVQEFRDRRLRRTFAGLVSEGLAALSAEGIRPVSPLPVPHRVLVWILRSPDWLYVRTARSMMSIDPEARSSMWEDLQRGRRTEVHLLNGEVVALADKHGLAAPLNRGIVTAIELAERGVDATAAFEEVVRRASGSR